jgi:hypothetical protein
MNKYYLLDAHCQKSKNSAKHITVDQHIIKLARRLFRLLHIRKLINIDVKKSKKRTLPTAI